MNGDDHFPNMVLEPYINVDVDELSNILEHRSKARPGQNLYICEFHVSTRYEFLVIQTHVFKYKNINYNDAQTNYYQKYYLYNA